MLASGSGVGSALSLLLIIGCIALVIMIVLRIGRLLSRAVVGIIANSVLGFAALFIIGYAFGIYIPLTTPILISVALFGLPGVGTLLVLKVIGAVALAVT
jgi:hypothetical protein